MTDLECRQIESKAAIHLIRCAFDDMNMTILEVSNALKMGVAGMINKIIEDMKERIPTDPRTKPYFDKIVADGFTEEQAVDIMIYAWIEGMNGDDGND